MADLDSGIEIVVTKEGDPWRNVKVGKVYLDEYAHEWKIPVELILAPGSDYADAALRDNNAYYKFTYHIILTDTADIYGDWTFATTTYPLPYGEEGAPSIWFHSYTPMFEDWSVPGMKGEVILSSDTYQKEASFRLQLQQDNWESDEFSYVGSAEQIIYLEEKKDNKFIIKSPVPDVIYPIEVWEEPLLHLYVPVIIPPQFPKGLVCPKDEAPCEFTLTEADGLKVGKHYIFESSHSVAPWISLTRVVPIEQVYKFEGMNVIDVVPLTDNVSELLCGLEGIEPGSEECKLALAEYIDPIYLANIASKAIRGKNLANVSEPVEAFDAVGIALIMIGTLLGPLVPAKSLRKIIATIIKKSEEIPAVKRYLAKDGIKIVQALEQGDKARVDKFSSELAEGNVNNAKEIIEDIIKNPSTSAHDVLGDIRNVADQAQKNIKSIPDARDSSKVLEILNKGHGDIINRAAEDVLKYRFVMTDDVRANLFQSAIENAIVRNPLTDVEIKAIPQLAHNNPEMFISTIQSLSKGQYNTFYDMLRAIKAPGIGEVIYPAKETAEMVYHARHLGKDFPIEEFLRKFPLAVIKGSDSEIAEALIRGFPTQTGQRVLAELRLLPESFIKKYPGIESTAVDALKRSYKLEGELGELAARKMVYEGDWKKLGAFFATLLARNWKAFFKIGAGSLAAIFTYTSAGICPMWFIEETPQTYSLPIYQAIKNEEFVNARNLMGPYEDYIDELEDPIVVWSKKLWPMWAPFIDMAMTAHRCQIRAYKLILGMPTEQPVLDEVIETAILKVKDGDTIDVGRIRGVPEVGDEAASAANFAGYVTRKAAEGFSPESEPDIPINMSVRFLGLDTIESRKGINGKYEVTRQTDFKDHFYNSVITKWYDPEKDLVNQVNGWMLKNYTGGVRLLSDVGNQWDDFNRFLAVPIVRGVELPIKELEYGFGALRFFLPNERVQSDIIKEGKTREEVYREAEAYARDMKLGVWALPNAGGDDEPYIPPVGAGTIQCITNPKGAYIYLDGYSDKTDKTPETLEGVPTGKHSVEFKETTKCKECSCGYDITLEPNETELVECELSAIYEIEDAYWEDEGGTQWHGENLAEPMVYLNISQSLTRSTGTHAPCKITFGREYTSPTKYTPLLFGTGVLKRDADFGMRTIELHKSGYKTMVERIDMQPGMHVTRIAAMERGDENEFIPIGEGEPPGPPEPPEPEEPGTLRVFVFILKDGVETSIPGTITIRDMDRNLLYSKSSASYSFELEAGDYYVKVAKADYNTQEHTVTVLPDGYSTETFILKPQEGEPPEPGTATLTIGKPYYIRAGVKEPIDYAEVFIDYGTDKMLEDSFSSDILELTFNVDLGGHTIKLRAGGFNDRDITVDIRGDHLITSREMSSIHAATVIDPYTYPTDFNVGYRVMCPITIVNASDSDATFKVSQIFEGIDVDHTMEFTSPEIFVSASEDKIVNIPITIPEEAIPTGMNVANYYLNTRLEVI